MPKGKRFHVGVSALGALLIGVGLGVAVTLILKDEKSQSAQSVQYPYLAKRIQTGIKNEIKVNFSELRKQLTDYINKQEGGGANISYYFEYLPTGVSININERNESIAASLMKLPVVMNLYKQAELGKIDLDKTVKLKKEWLNSEYGTLYKQGEGYPITIREAAKLTLKDSDNTALLLIWDQLKPLQTSPDQDALNYLDIDYDIVSGDRAQVGAMSYSSITKCLYFACFNNEEDSQQMLLYLTESSFNDRLTKHLQGKVEVAHKIGTFNTQYQSDCGIVYLENKNYSICVMVKGKDPLASEEIAELSKLTYDYLAQ